MPAQYGFKDLTATGRYAVAVDKIGNDNVAALTIGVGNSAWTCTGTFQANPFTASQDPNNLGWMNIESVRLDTYAFEQTPTLTANTANSWKASCTPFAQVAFNVTAITGDIPFNISTFQDPAGVGVTLTAATSQAISGTLTITSASASSLAVGANGSTNPVLQVDDSASSVKTGVKVTGAAAGSGAAIAAISNATNEQLTIDSKGSSPVLIGSVSTGGGNIRASVATVAASGTAIGNAAAVTEGYTYVTGGNNANAVKLPAGAVGMVVKLVNAVYTATLQVFPQVNNAINNLANNAVYNIPNGGERTFTYTTAGQWYAAPQTIV